MKWIYPLFIIAAVIILGGSLYLMFGQQQKCAVQSAQEKILTGVIPVREIKAGMDVLDSYYSNYSEFVTTSMLYLDLAGDLKSISADSIILVDRDTKKELEIPIISTKPLVYLVPENGNYGKLIPTTDKTIIKIGDRVGVQINIDNKTGKPVVQAISKLK
ncbi:MAG: hypothetical protein Q7S14_01800 [bacterium]|nr:hypothetical protein [bacterium]